MYSDENNHDRLRSESDALLRTVVFDRLSRTMRTPDLTSPIMRKLGYVPADARAARRARRIRTTGRAAATLIVCATFAIGIHVMNHRPTARIPAGLSLPNALEHDLQQQGARLIEFINDVRLFSPRWPNAPLPGAADDSSIDANGCSERRWPIDREVDESACAPFQWI